MAWRKWIVRGLVFTILAGIGCAVWLYQYWTNPTVVRQHVIEKLQAMFPGAVVTLDSARLRILGGISLSELRLSRKDDPQHGELLHIPAGVIYHDKEKLLDGVLSIRKVELQRPRLHVVRQLNGSWNIDGLTGPAKDGLEPIPTIVIHQGTLVIEDRQGGAELPNLEVNNVSLTLINDPAPIITVEGTAASEALGTLEITGAWNRASRAAELKARAQGVPVNRAMVQRMASACPSFAGQGLQLEGKAQIDLDLKFRPSATEPVTYTVHCDLSKGKLQHPKLCLPLDDVSARVHIDNHQVVLDALDARAGTTLIHVAGAGQLPDLEQNFEAEVDIKHLNVDAHFIDRLPENLQLLGLHFEPSGLMGVHIECARRDGAWVAHPKKSVARVVLMPENMKVNYLYFRYPMDRMSGTVEFDLLSGHVKSDLTAYTGTQPIVITGSWQGKHDQVDCKFDIQANNVPVDAKLLDALKGPMRSLAQSYHPRGLADIKAHIRHVPGMPATQYHQEYHVHLHDLAILWDEFPYPVEEMNGLLEIYPQHWRFDLRGTHNGGELSLQGQSTARDSSPHKGMLVKIAGKNVALDGDLRKALNAPGLGPLGRAWDAFVPSGRMSINATIERPPGPPSPDGSMLHGLHYDFTGGGLSLTPLFLPYKLDEVRGALRYHSGALELTDITARHGATELKLDKATVDLHAGGYNAKLHALYAYRLYLDDDLLKALPGAMSRTCAALNVKDPLGLAMQVHVAQPAEPGSPPAIGWDGAIRFENSSLSTGLQWSDATGTIACRGVYHNRQIKVLQGNFKLDQGTLLRQPFRDVNGHFWVEKEAPETLKVNLASAPLFGGDISGPIRFNFGHTPSYELNLTASQINLEEFGKHNFGPQSALQGRAGGRLFLTGQGSSAETLDGNGSIDIPNGKLLNLPLLLDLLKFLGLRLPDRTAFDEAKAVFAIRGRRLRMDKLELIGNAVSLYGKGDFLIDGTDLKLDFYPAWGRIQQLVVPAWRAVPAEIGKQMLKIEMRGKVTSNPDDLKFTKKPMPTLLDPFYQIRERLMGEPEWRRSNPDSGSRFKE